MSHELLGLVDPTDDGYLSESCITLAIIQNSNRRYSRDA